MPSVPIRDENRSPLNQSSLKALQHFQADADPTIPYSLQLALWTLENRSQAIPYPADQFISDLTLEAQVMLGWQPAAIAATMDDEAETLSQQADSLTPLTLAARLVENLHENLQRQLPLLRTPETSWK